MDIHAPDHQYKQCQPNMHCIWSVLEKTVKFRGNKWKIKSNFENKISSCLRVNSFRHWKYAHGLLFVAVCYGLVSLILPISFSYDLLALEQSHDWNIDSEATLWILVVNYEQLMISTEQNKAQQSCAHILCYTVYMLYNSLPFSLPFKAFQTIKIAMIVIQYHLICQNSHS